MHFGFKGRWHALLKQSTSIRQRNGTAKSNKKNWLLLIGDQIVCVW